MLQPRKHAPSLQEFAIAARCTQWSPHLRSKDLLAVGADFGVTLLQRVEGAAWQVGRGWQDDSFSTRWKLKTLHTYTFGTAVKQVAFSPACTPSNVVMAASCADHSIQLISGESTLRLGGVSGHSKSIYGLDVVETEEGTTVASTGGDRVLIIWQQEIPTTFALKSVGVSVHFHPENTPQILVCEETGAIRVLDWETSSWLVSIYSGPAVTYVDYLCNAVWLTASKVAAVSRQGEWRVWDIGHIRGSLNTQPLYSGRIGDRCRRLIPNPDTESQFIVVGSRTVWLLDLALDGEPTQRRPR